MTFCSNLQSEQIGILYKKCQQPTMSSPAIVQSNLGHRNKYHIQSKHSNVAVVHRIVAYSVAKEKTWLGERRRRSFDGPFRWFG